MTWLTWLLHIITQSKMFKAIIEFLRIIKSRVMELYDYHTERTSNDLNRLNSAFWQNPYVQLSVDKIENYLDNELLHYVWFMFDKAENYLINILIRDEYFLFVVDALIFFTGFIAANYFPCSMLYVLVLSWWYSGSWKRSLLYLIAFIIGVYGIEFFINL